MQFNHDPRARDLASTGSRSATTNNTQATVTRSSIRVKALIDLARGDCIRSSCLFLTTCGAGKQACERELRPGTAFMLSSAIGLAG